jgi:hypothetical protein
VCDRMGYQNALHITPRLRAAASPGGHPVVCCTTAAAACMVIRTVCDRFKHCPPAVQYEWGMRDGDGSLSLFAVLVVFVWCVFATRTGWPVVWRSLFLSFFFFFFFTLYCLPYTCVNGRSRKEKKKKKKIRGGTEQTVRCEGCIIVRIIRRGEREQ